jgi:hypothetical protein
MSRVVRALTHDRNTVKIMAEPLADEGAIAFCAHIKGIA